MSVLLLKQPPVVGRTFLSSPTELRSPEESKIVVAPPPDDSLTLNSRRAAIVILTPGACSRGRSLASLFAPRQANP